MKRTGKVTREIYARMRAGDREAFDRFYERQAARLLVYLQYNMGPRLRRKLDPTDLLQNVYLRLFKGFASFCRRVEARGIHRALIRMADHEISEAYRYHFKVDKRAAQREVTASCLEAEESRRGDFVAQATAKGTSATARLARQEEYRRILAMLRQLSPLEQYVVVARIIEEIPAQEIAARLGKTRGAVQMLIARARDKLRDRAGRENI